MSSREWPDRVRDPRDRSNTSSISKSDTDEGIGEFWDGHDFTEFDSGAPDVEFTVSLAVPVEVELFSAIEKEARKHGVNVETLVNLWLQEKLAEQV
mgnify:CR=1 FL=1